MSFSAQSIRLLRKSAAQFRFYEQSHRAKVRPHFDDPVQRDNNNAALDKARVNAELAQEIERFLDEF